MVSRYQPIIDEADEYLATLSEHLPEWHAAREAERVAPFVERVRQTAVEAHELRDHLSAILSWAAAPQTEENQAGFLRSLDEAKAYLSAQENALQAAGWRLAHAISTWARLQMMRDLAAGLDIEEWSTTSGAFVQALADIDGDEGAHKGANKGKAS